MEKNIKIIKIIINSLMTLILVVGITFIFLYFIGIEPFVVISGSMEPAIETGSLSLINKHTNYEDIKINDVIAFTNSMGDRVTHRVINITEEGIETKGDKNDLSDGSLTTEENYIGKNIFSIPRLGYVIKMIQTTRGKILLVTFVIFILLAAFLIDDKKVKN